MSIFEENWPLSIHLSIRNRRARHCQSFLQQPWPLIFSLHGTSISKGLKPESRLTHKKEEKFHVLLNLKLKKKNKTKRIIKEKKKGQNPKHVCSLVVKARGIIDSPLNSAPKWNKRTKKKRKQKKIRKRKKEERKRQKKDLYFKIIYLNSYMTEKRGNKDLYFKTLKLFDLNSYMRR